MSIVLRRYAGSRPGSSDTVRRLWRWMTRRPAPGLDDARWEHLDRYNRHRRNAGVDELMNAGGPQLDHGDQLKKHWPREELVQQREVVVKAFFRNMIEDISAVMAL